MKLHTNTIWHILQSISGLEINPGSLPASSRGPLVLLSHLKGEEIKDQLRLEAGFLYSKSGFILNLISAHLQSRKLATTCWECLLCLSALVGWKQNKQKMLALNLNSEFIWSISSHSLPPFDMVWSRWNQLGPGLLPLSPGPSRVTTVRYQLSSTESCLQDLGDIRAHTIHRIFLRESGPEKCTVVGDLGPWMWEVEVIRVDRGSRKEVQFYLISLPRKPERTK